MSIGNSRKMLCLLLVVCLITLPIFFMTSCLDNANGKDTDATDGTTANSSDKTDEATTDDITNETTDNSITTINQTDTTVDETVPEDPTSDITITEDESTEETVPEVTTTVMDEVPRSANARFNGETIRFIVEEGSIYKLSKRSISPDFAS